MTRKRAKKLLPVITAWAEGKNIQYQNTAGKWVRYTGDEPAFWNREMEWRIEPVPVERWLLKFVDGSIGHTAYHTKKAAQEYALSLDYKFFPTPVRFVEVVE